MSLTSIVFLRHSKATPHKDDRKRVLSEEGIALAQERRLKLGNPKFDLVMHSDRFRTEQTARIIAGIGDDVPTVAVPQLMPQETDPWNAAVTAAWGKIGNAPLEKYLREVRLEMYVAATIGAAALDYHLKSQVVYPKNILVVGHAIFTPAICDAMNEYRDRDVFMGNPLMECQGFEMRKGETSLEYSVRFIE